MPKQPYWLELTSLPDSHAISESMSFSESDDAVDLLTQLLGPPAGYADPLTLDMMSRRSQEWLIKVDIDGVEYDASQIVDISIENGVTPSDEFTLGAAVISRCVVTLKTTDTIPPNARVIPYVALSLASLTWDSAESTWDDADFAWDGSSTTEWLPLGVFYVDNREQVNNVLVLDCLDGLVYADVAYVSQLDYPASMQDVWDEVCAQAGLIYDSSVQIDPSHTLNAGPAGYTCRQVMGFIAGVHGASVKMSRIGEVSWRVYRADEQPVHELTTADYMRVKQTNPAKTYTRVVVTYDEDDQLTYEAGSGDDNHTLYLTNPLMTQQMVDDLLAQINGFSYVPIEMDARGYPLMEHGDRIIYQVSESLAWAEMNVSWDDADIAWDGLRTYQTLILRQTFTFKGGLGMTIEAPSISEQESEFGIDGSLTAAVNRLNQNAVRYGKPYYGVTHSRTEGIVVQREDGLAKAVFNADELSFYAESERALWFDVPNRRFVFGGHLEAASGTFTGELQGGSITIGSGNNVFRADTQGIWAGHASWSDAPFYVNMAGELWAEDAHISGTITGSTITGSTINGGSIFGSVITGGTIQSAGSGIYPRFVLDASTREITFQADATQFVRMGAYFGDTRPYLMFFNSYGATRFTKIDDYLEIFGDVSFVNELMVDYSNLVDRNTGNNFWYFYSFLQSLIGGKQDAFTGLTGYYTVGSQLWRFLNGVLVEVI